MNRRRYLSGSGVSEYQFFIGQIHCFSSPDVVDGDGWACVAQKLLTLTGVKQEEAERLRPHCLLQRPPW